MGSNKSQPSIVDRDDLVARATKLISANVGFPRASPRLILLGMPVSECKIERSNYLEFEWVTQTQTPMIDLPNEEFLQ